MSPSEGFSWTPKLTVLFSFIESFIFLFISTGDLFLIKDPFGALSSSAYSPDLVVASVSLLSIPFIFGGFMGIVSRQEKLVRSYLFYMLGGLVLFAAYVSQLMFMPAACDQLLTAEDALRGNLEGPCGGMASRHVEMAALAVLEGIHLCLIHPLYSFCEELRGEGSSRDRDLSTVPAADVGTVRKQAYRQLRKGPLANVQGRLVGEYGSLFEAVRGLSWMGNTAQATQLGQQSPYLPNNMRLV